MQTIEIEGQNYTYSEVVNLYGQVYADNVFNTEEKVERNTSEEKIKVNKNITRNIPTQGEFMKKKYNDLVYSYLQYHSYKGLDKNDQEIYFIYDTPTLIREITKETGSSTTRTTRKRVDKLIEGGFIHKDKVWNKTHTELVEGYVINHIDTFFQKVPTDTLRFLTNTHVNFAIKIYAYLLNKSIYVNKHYVFTYTELILNCLGVKNANHGEEYERVRDILTSLMNNGLVIYEEIYEPIGEGNTTIRQRIVQINLDYYKPIKNKKRN